MLWHLSLIQHLAIRRVPCLVQLGLRSRGLSCFGFSLLCSCLASLIGGFTLGCRTFPPGSVGRLWGGPLPNLGALLLSGLIGHWEWELPRRETGGVTFHFFD